MSECKHQVWNGNTGKCLECGISYVEAMNRYDATIARLTRDIEAHKEVGESLMKEVKRLDKEVARLTRELEEWRNSRDGVMEQIEKIEAENAALKALRDELFDRNAALKEKVEKVRELVRSKREYCDTYPNKLPLIGCYDIEQIIGKP